MSEQRSLFTVISVLILFAPGVQRELKTLITVNNYACEHVVLIYI